MAEERGPVSSDVLSRAKRIADNAISVAVARAC